MMVFLNMLGVLAFAFLVLGLMGIVSRMAEWITDKTRTSFRSHRK